MRFGINLQEAKNKNEATTSSPIESTDSTLTVLDYEGPQQREAGQITIDNWPQPTEFRSWKISFNSEVSHSMQYPRAARPWTGEVEDATSTSELITSASLTGDPIPDFENLDFKTASGLNKIQTGSFKKQSPQPKEKLNQRRDH